MEDQHTKDRRSYDAASVPFSLAGRVFQESAILAAEGGSPLRPIANQLILASERLGQPMRLAVVGQIKRGKSTLVNALLGEDIAATGQLELTFTVSEFRHDEYQAIFVRYKDGTSEGPLPRAFLAGLTVRDPAMIDQLRKIRKVEFAMPNDLLRTFRLIDTPGLGSVHMVDAQNTLDFLGVSDAFAEQADRSKMRKTMSAMDRTAHDVHEDSIREMDEADAVLYLFSRGLHESDYTTVAQFLGPAGGSMTPLRAFAVLSRCDEYWPPDRDLPGNPDPFTYDPMAAGRKIAERYLAELGIRRLFFTVLPVAGLVGIGARLLTEKEYCWLDDLRTVEPEVLVRRLRDISRFATEDPLPDVTLPVAMRRRLIDLLGGWGIYLACGYLRDRLGADEIRDRLVVDSGVSRMRELIIGHFGNRASVIKLDHGIQDITQEIGRCWLTMQQADRQIPEAVDIIAGRIEQLRISDHDVAELSTLSALYNEELDLTKEEKAELLAVTGENGLTCAARLGLAEDTPLQQLAAAAERLAEKWAVREQDPTLNRATLRAARTIRRSYDRTADQIRRAQHPDTPMTGAE